jgi:nicotinamidase-related amidase
MQRDFLAPDGLCGQLGLDLGPVRAIVPRVAALLDAARSAGLYIVHTREGYAPDLSDVNPYKRSRGGIGQPGPLGRCLIRGEPGHDFIDELRPLPGEAVVDKPGYGAFYRTDLQELLAARGIDHLIVTGVTTQCCVQSTLREAVDRGYFCLTVADACAAFEPAHHAATIDVIQSEDHLFGWIADTDEVLRGLA